MYFITEVPLFRYVRGLLLRETTCTVVVDGDTRSSTTGGTTLLRSRGTVVYGTVYRSIIRYTYRSRRSRTYVQVGKFAHAVVRLIA